ncbi:SDR family oxidoreductase [Thermodesulfobacteriota bacterium]
MDLGRELTMNHLTGAHYAASKGGIRTMTFNLASEVGRYGITVNNIAPGRIQTHMADLVSNAINDAILEHIPLGRFGVPEEVGDAVVFLASDKSSYITGTTFNISGGYVTS